MLLWCSNNSGTTSSRYKSAAAFHNVPAERKVAAAQIHDTLHLMIPDKLRNKGTVLLGDRTA